MSNTLAIHKALIAANTTKKAQVVWEVTYSGQVSGVDYFSSFSQPFERDDPRLGLSVSNSYFGNLVDRGSMLYVRNEETSNTSLYFSEPPPKNKELMSAQSFVITKRKGYKHFVRSNRQVMCSPGPEQEGGGQWVEKSIQLVYRESTDGGTSNGLDLIGYPQTGEWVWMKVLKVNTPVLRDPYPPYQWLLDVAESRGPEAGTWDFDEAIADPITAEYIGKCCGGTTDKVIRSYGVWIAGFGTVTMPAVVGTSRRIHVNESGVMVGVYIDVPMNGLVTIDSGKVSLERTGNPFARVSGSVKLPETVGKFASDAEFETLFPMSFSPWLNFLSGKEVAREDTSETIDGVTCTTRKLKFNVTEGIGKVEWNSLKDAYTSGWGILPTKSASVIDKIGKSWMKVTNHVAYRLATYDCSGYTVRETAMFKAYKRKRERACKENDFLDKSYNDEYTWKTVDNKLGQLISADVLSMDGGLISDIYTTPTISKMVVIPEHTITFSNMSNGTVVYSDTEKGSGTVEATAAAVGELLESLGARKYTGPALAQVNTLLGLDLAAIKDEGDVLSGLRPIDAQISNALDFVAYQSTHSYDQCVALLSAQLTDYKDFNAGIKTVLRSVAGDRLYPKLISKLGGSNG